MVGGVSNYLMQFADGILHRLGGVSPYVLPMYLQGDSRRLVEPQFNANTNRNDYNKTPWGSFYPMIDSKRISHHRRYHGMDRNPHRHKAPKINRSPIVVTDWFGKTTTFPYVPQRRFSRKR